MTKVKTTLRMLAHLLRVMGTAIEHWPVVLLMLCIVSPISPHVRFQYPCTYIGTRGIVASDALTCPLITIIDTRKDGGAWW